MKTFFVKDKIRQIETELSQRDLDIVFGNDSTLVSVFLYANYGCPYCCKFFNEVYPAIEDEYINSGKVKIIMRLTFNSANQDLTTAMKVAVCVNKFGNYEYLHQLFLSQSNIVYTTDFHDMVDEFIDKDIQVAECILGGAADEYIKDNIEEFEALNLKGVPTFVIESKIYYGFKEYDSFKKILDYHLTH
ncbi:MAG TPA: thioredoxin domain-containing protein [Salinivirgaceae bacterium]|nr:thioredoxin domain-containing protein [Salinivirgaceae bacterium]